MTIPTLTRGDDYILKIILTEADGTPVPCAGDKIFVTMKINQNDPDAIAVFQYIAVMPAGADATAGIHRVQMPNTLNVGKLFYDVQWKRDVSGGGGIYTIENLSFSVSQDVTLAVT